MGGDRVGRATRLALLVAALVVAGGGGALAAPGTPVASGAVRVVRDVAYVPGGGAARSLDLCLPTGDGPRPLVVWIHGGGWRGGDKRGVGVRYLVADGYALASINYRLSEAATFPAQIQDVNAALGFLRAHAAEYGLDPNRFVVAGSSAGGHLAALAGLSANDHPAGFGTDPAVTIAAIVDFFGPTDLTVASGAGALPSGPVAQVLGRPVAAKADLARAASPVTYADAGDPPTLILHGDQDRTVPLAQSQELERTLTKAGVDATLVVLPGAGHGDPAFGAPATRAKVVAFLARVLAPRGG